MAKHGSIQFLGNGKIKLHLHENQSTESAKLVQDLVYGIRTNPVGLEISVGGWMMGLRMLMQGTDTLDLGLFKLDHTFTLGLHDGGHKNVSCYGHDMYFSKK